MCPDAGPGHGIRMPPMPIPARPDGGIPCSSACRKSSSWTVARPSPTVPNCRAAGLPRAFDDSVGQLAGTAVVSPNPRPWSSRQYHTVRRSGGDPYLGTRPIHPIGGKEGRTRDAGGAKYGFRSPGVSARIGQDRAERVPPECGSARISMATAWQRHGTVLCTGGGLAGDAVLKRGELESECGNPSRVAKVSVDLSAGGRPGHPGRR
jgi:hypothetical protein